MFLKPSHMMKRKNQIKGSIIYTYPHLGELKGDKNHAYFAMEGLE